MQQIVKTKALKADKYGDVKGTFRIPLDIMKTLKHKAIEENTSVNTLVVKALRELLSKK